MMVNSVTVITVTRDRPELLKRAIASVQHQDYKGPINHLIIVDECPITLAILEESSVGPKILHWQVCHRNAGEQSGTPRLAKLLNFAVQISDSRWISFLDDDNELEPKHISSLVDCAINNECPAVHSYMQIFNKDSTPYLEARHPWTRDIEEGKKIYQELCGRGIFQHGYSIVRDRVDPWDHPDPARTVDKGEWLFERQLLLKYPFSTEYTTEDIVNNIGDDDKMMEILVENKVPIACTKLPTLKYYLGGYSNTFN